MVFKSVWRNDDAITEIHTTMFFSIFKLNELDNKLEKNHMGEDLYPP